MISSVHPSHVYMAPLVPLKLYAVFGASSVPKSSALPSMTLMVTDELKDVSKRYSVRAERVSIFFVSTTGAVGSSIVLFARVSPGSERPGIAISNGNRDQKWKREE